jgi:hypothetical protein
MITKMHENDFAISPEDSEELLQLIAESMHCSDSQRCEFETFLNEFTRLDERAKREEFNVWVELMRKSLEK